MIRHKKIRLGPSNYAGQQFYFITMCCFDRRKIFQDPQRCLWLLDVFRRESAARDFAIPAYCVMPDHFHFLAGGLRSSSDLLHFMKSFKLKTSRAYQRQTSRVLWQKKFFDHILRPDESPESVAWYIWLNPVRKGLSAEAGLYPFAGSFTSLWQCRNPDSGKWSPPARAEPG
jgi:putative transposase